MSLKWLFSWFAPQVQIDLVVQDFQEASDRLKQVIEGVMISKEVQHTLINNANIEIEDLNSAFKRANKIKNNIDKILN